MLPCLSNLDDFGFAHYGALLRVAAYDCLALE